LTFLSIIFITFAPKFNKNYYGIEIKSSPVLTGKAAQEFYERWATFKDDTSPEVVKESFRKSKEFFAKYHNPYK